jgi:hypothetical protein
LETPMQIELRPLDQITPYPGNPRINDGAVDAVAASLQEFGFRQPIVVDEQGVIVKKAETLGDNQIDRYYFDALNISKDAVHAALVKGGVPCTVKDLEERFEGFVRDLTKGKDASKIRVVVE